MIAAVIGKGGAGKTTVTALLLRCLLEAGERPLLAVDADPSNCLGPALGMTVDNTLADMREGLRSGDQRPPSMSPGEWLALKAEDAIVENTGFDLLTMGRPEGKGCYCFVNNLIREHLDRLARSYRHVLVDCEAGLEHLSRRTSGRPDALVCVANRSRMAAETLRRSWTLYRAIHGALPPRVDLVLNGFDQDAPAVREIAGDVFERVFLVPHDPEVAALECAGRPLTELSASSPALAALRGWRP